MRILTRPGRPAAFALLLAACSVAGGQMSDALELCDAGSALRGTVTAADGAVEWSLTVDAPDACYRAGDARFSASSDGRASLDLTLVREPGICAQVITPVTFEGQAAAEGSVEEVTVTLRDDPPTAAPPLTARFAKSC